MQRDLSARPEPRNDAKAAAGSRPTTLVTGAFMALLLAVTGCSQSSRVAASVRHPVMSARVRPAALQRTRHGLTTGLRLGSRQYDLYAPKQEPRALLIVLHSADRRPWWIEQTAGLEPAALAHGWWIAYPASAGGDWDVGSCCGGAGREHTDDIGFLRSLIGHLRKRSGRPSLPTYVIGDSNGAMLALWYACHFSVSGVVAVSGNLQGNCPAPIRSRFLVLRGTEDRTVPLAGTRSSTLLGDALQPDSLLLRQLPRGCRQTARYGRARVTATGCGRQPTGWYIVIAGHGHNWPRKEDGSSVDATALIVQFVLGQLRFR
jgi:poly(3-hydroxybutyrate) depolymerase